MYMAARACARAPRRAKPPEGIEPPLRGLKPRVLPLDQSGFGRRRGASVVFFIIRRGYGHVLGRAELGAQVLLGRA